MVDAYNDLTGYAMIFNCATDLFFQDVMIPTFPISLSEITRIAPCFTIDANRAFQP